MDFSHQKLLYLMCLTLWISSSSSSPVFSWGFVVCDCSGLSTVNLELGSWFNSTVIPRASIGVDTLYFLVCLQFWGTKNMLSSLAKIGNEGCVCKIHAFPSAFW
jgi:hypothetical protein